MSNNQITKSATTGSTAGRPTPLSLSQKPEIKADKAIIRNGSKVTSSGAVLPMNANVPISDIERNNTSQDVYSSTTGEKETICATYTRSNETKADCDELDVKLPISNKEKQSNNEGDTENTENNSDNREEIQSDIDSEIHDANKSLESQNKKKHVFIINENSNNVNVVEKKEDAKHTIDEAPIIDSSKIVPVDKIDPNSGSNTLDKSKNIDSIEMECLVVDSEVHDGRTVNLGKILKLKASSSIQSLCKTPEKSLPNAILECEHSIRDSYGSARGTDKPSISSLRSISGRRSLRLLPELVLRNGESYNNYKTGFNRTSSSMNVTVGSVVSNDSSLSFFGLGRKRERIDATDNQIVRENSPKSPKRARLDVYSFLDVVKTPLSVLRSRFSKTSIQSSTPNKKRVQKEEEDGVENVSVVEEAADNDLDSSLLDETDKKTKEVEYEDLFKHTDNIERYTAEELTAQMRIEPIEILNKRKACNIM